MARPTKTAAEALQILRKQYAREGRILLLIVSDPLGLDIMGPLSDEQAQKVYASYTDDEIHEIDRETAMTLSEQWSRGTAGPDGAQAMIARSLRWLRAEGLIPPLGDGTKWDVSITKLFPGTGHGVRHFIEYSAADPEAARQQAQRDLDADPRNEGWTIESVEPAA